MRRLMAVSLLVALAATACGKGGSNQALAKFDQLGFVSAAANSSAAKGTAKISMVMNFTLPQIGAVTAHADGVMDVVHKAAQLTMSFPIEGQKLTFEAIVSNGVVYEKLPADMRSALGIKKPWLSMKIAAKGSSPLGLGNITDPTAAFDALRSIATSVTKLGSVAVRGVDTTEYLVTLDINKLAPSAPARQKQELAGLGLSEMNVFVSADKLIRREEMSISVAGNTVKATIDLFDYGAPVHVSVPPASQVGDLNQALGKLQNS